MFHLVYDTEFWGANPINNLAAEGGRHCGYYIDKNGVQGN